jgi:hypothetical protein
MAANRVRASGAVQAMRLRRWKTFWRSLRRRLIPGLTLVAYLVAAVGFPLPAAGRRPGDPPAPCGNQLCGCENADHGPRRCCCAAAKAPAEEKAPPAARCPHCAKAHAEQPKPAPTKCCQAQARGAGTAKSETTHRACCANHDSKPAADPPAPPPEQPRGRPCGLTGNCCQTLLTLWVSYRAVLSPGSETGWQPSLAPRGWLTASAGPVPHLPLTPPDPPPRSPL